LHREYTLSSQIDPSQTADERVALMSIVEAQRETVDQRLKGRFMYVNEFIALVVANLPKR
jgi:hypothetical protein